MSKEPPGESRDADALSLDELAEIDRICVEFERAWKEGREERIEDRLAGVVGAVRERLLRELLALESHYRRQRGEAPTREELLRRFPDHAHVVESVLSSASVGSGNVTGTLGKGTAGLHVRCPHCHQPIELVAEDLDEVSCPSCGSRFHLAGARETVTHRDDAGKTIAQYRLIEKLGVGAFGTVWKAHDSTLDRVVALKLPRAGHLDDGDADVFLREARAAAQLRHANIVGVHEVGRHDGKVFIASDYVEGANLKEWLSARRLTPREAAELCTKIAEALHFAHERGVIHRDLKPANVMMDLAGQPHLMDFGLARREAGEITMTLDGQVLGTPAYMSPEQARGQAHQADRRSDVYSLGVILYELLTGELPFRGESRMLIVQILQDEPQPPRRLNARIPRDLETICLKCLEKESGRRYATAHALAEDLKRYVDSKSILARPIGPAGRTWRWCKRKPTLAALCATAALLVLTLAIGGPIVAAVVGAKNTALAAANSSLDTTNTQLADANRELDTTNMHLTTANANLDATNAELTTANAALEKANQAEREAREESERRLEQTEKGMELLGGIFADLDPNAEEIEGRELRLILGNRLIQAANQLEGESIGDAVAVADVQTILGKSLCGLGLYDQAIQILAKARDTRERELGLSHAETLTTIQWLAIAYQSASRHADALLLFEEALARSRESLGPNHPETLVALGNRAQAYVSAGEVDTGVQLHEQAVRALRESLGPDDLATVDSTIALAEAYYFAERVKESVPLLEQGLVAETALRGPDHPKTLKVMCDLAEAYRSTERFDEALRIGNEALARRRKKLGLNHPDTLMSMNNLAVIYASAHRIQESIALHEETLLKRRERLGPTHSDTLASMSNLAEAYRSVGSDDEALQLLDEILTVCRKNFGSDHPTTLKWMSRVGAGYRSAGRSDKAIELQAEALAKQRARLGDDHPYTLISMHNLAVAYESAGRDMEALQLHRETFTRRRETLGPDHLDTLSSMSHLGTAYQSAGRSNEAIPIHSQVLAKRTKKLGADHPDTLMSMNNLAAAYCSAGYFPEALHLHRETWIKRQKVLGFDHADTLVSMRWLGEVYKSLGRYDEAIEVHRELLRLRTSKLGAVHPDTLKDVGYLARAYWSAGQLDKSVPLFENLVRRYEAKVGRSHPATLLSVANLGVNYMDAGRLAEALPLLEEAYDAAIQHPSLHWVRSPLLACYQAVLAENKGYVDDVRAQLPKESPQLATRLAMIAWSLLAAHSFADAEPLLRECLAIREKELSDDWLLFDTKSMLGTALLAHGTDLLVFDSTAAAAKFTEAEPLLIEGYEGMKQRADSIPLRDRVRLVEAVQSVVRLYTVWEKPKEAARWKAELDTYNGAGKPDRSP